MFTIEPVGYVSNSRKSIEDDFWGDIVSVINISPKLSEESLKGIEHFSHLEIIFYFHLADPSNICISSAHPRENPDYPETGIFAQRKKLRPNLLGSTIVKLKGIDKRKLTVTGLDAIDGTPVIDIKPVLEEFLPSGKIVQPEWTHDLMENYWKK
ncbi:MAG TPA: SAM-dependent methyltransferase [Ignavibacteria bacterium]|nr:tRNA (N6-threonylcarbamoyladenosine(37)-N6)-methyltransferase TrmO [Bacteroidota bacterium]HRI86005.1 SAM-dependent methyltransferase [Ignavibacteria bacterium]HRK00499.1 SAM-dependent methyltransferase [Ignavibacteria bacterium]